MKLCVLHGDADLAGDRRHEIQVVLLEPAAAVAGVDLHDANGFPLFVEERHAHQRADLAVGDARRYPEIPRRDPCSGSPGRRS